MNERDENKELSATEVEAVSVLMSIKPPEIIGACPSDQGTAHSSHDRNAQKPIPETYFPAENRSSKELLPSRSSDKNGRWNQAEHQRFLQVLSLECVCSTVQVCVDTSLMLNPYVASLGSCAAWHCVETRCSGCAHTNTRAD